MSKRLFTEDEVTNWHIKPCKNVVDKTGITNGKVTVIKYKEKSSWFCRCHCGNIFPALPANVKKGATKSCGCTRGKDISEKSTKPREDVLKLLKEVVPNYQVLEEKEKATGKWKFTCTLCEHTFLSAPAQLYGKRKRKPCKCSPSYRRTQEEWDEELGKICYEKGYDYKGTYRDDKYNLYVNLHCPIHNHSWSPNTKHVLNGHGCTKCGDDITSSKNKVLTTEIIISNFENVHGTKYDYSLLEYDKWDDKLPIMCPDHGLFYQRYKDHLKATYGCPSCALYGFKPKEPATLYLLSTEKLCKVGITNNDVDKRLQQINTSGGKDFKVVDSVYFTEGTIAQDHEKFILNEMNISFGDKDCYSGSTEVTDISNLPEILQYMKGLKEKYE